MAGFAAQLGLDARACDAPIDLEAVAWQAGVQLVSHRAVEVSQVNAAGRAELVEVESGVAALQGVESPCDQIDSLGQDDLALLQFQRVTDAAVAVTGQRARDVRAMLHAAARRQADEAEDEADHPLFAFNNVERAEHHAAVLMRRHQSLESDDLDVLHSPDFALEPFDGMVFIFCFDRSNLDSHSCAPQREDSAADESNGRGRRRDGGTERRRDRETEGPQRRSIQENILPLSPSLYLSVSPSLRPSVSIRLTRTLSMRRRSMSTTSTRRPSQTK